MSNFDLSFGKVHIYVKGWLGINLGASHETGTHPIIDRQETLACLGLVLLQFGSVINCSICMSCQFYLKSRV